MIKKYISESTAKAGIFLVFVVTLTVCILFTWSAGVLNNPALAAAQGEEDVVLESYDSELLLRQIEILENQLASLQGQLSQTEAENQQLLQTLVEVEDSFSIEYAGSFYTTAYCVEAYPHICGGNGVTASGTVPTPGVTIAADWSVLPAGTWVYIDGVGIRRVEDKGSAIQGNKIDIALATHNLALQWGNSDRDVWIINWDD